MSGKLKVYGHIVCHNEFPDILRAIESLYACCDEILIAYGGKPKTDLREFLELRKDIYRMKIYDNPFETVLKQRQLLLDKTPKNNWVVSLDPDEKFSHLFELGLKGYISQIKPEIYSDPKRKLPLVIPVNHYNLYGDIFHYGGEPCPHNMKAFYYDRDLEYYDTDSGGFFVHITYKSNKLKGVTLLFKPIKGFNILHYARLCPQRLKWRKKQKGDVKTGYTEDAWKTEEVMVQLPGECY